MKPTLIPGWKSVLLAAGALIAACQMGGCVAYSEDGYYSSGVYDYGWSDPFYYGGYGYYRGGYYGGGYYPGGGGNRPDYNPGDRLHVEHHGGLGPGSGANVRPSYGGGGVRGGGGFRGGGGRR